MAAETITSEAADTVAKAFNGWKWLLNVAIMAAAVTAGWMAIALIIRRYSLLDSRDEDLAVAEKVEEAHDGE